MTATLALDRIVYAPPALAWSGEPAQQEGGVIFAVLLGFSLAAASALAAYCISVGGSPTLSFGWRGFTLTCYRR